MDPHGSVIDFDWVGVGFINNYAMFLGYMLMGVRGLGLLVLMWSTIIFLGSFISLMQKDFWSLVVIMLIQTAGALDLLLKEKLEEVVNSVWELLVVLVSTAVRPMRTLGDVSIRRSILAMVLLFGLWLVQLLVFYIISRPLAFLCVYGMHISAGISLWRLVEHDFGNADVSANLNSALQMLYSLGVAQGLLYGYRAIYAAGARIKLAEDVADFFSLDLDIVSNYLFETIKGCSKDPSFARGRNLATYAVDMMLDYKSSDRYLSGVKILSTLIQKQTQVGSKLGRLSQIKQLLTGSTYFNHIVQNLLWTLGPRSPYSMEIREQAAIIVSHVACDIRLEQFPGGIQCISCLLDTPEEHHWRPEGYQRTRLPNMYGRDWLLEKFERDWLLEKHNLNLKRFLEETAGPVSVTQNSDSNNNQLQLQGLRILRKLTVNDGNCRVMSNTEDLVAKAMAPLVSYRQHQDNHAEWSIMAEEALELMSRLMAAPGKTGKKLCREITSSGKATSTLERIIGCEDCKAKVQRLAVETVLDLSVDTSSIMASATSSTIFITTLLELFLSKNIRGDPLQRVGSRRTQLDLMQRNWAERCSSSSIHWMKKQSHIRNLAGEKLAFLSRHSEENATIILQTGRDVVGDLVKTTVDAKINNIHKISAVRILEHLCSSCTMDDDHLLGLKVAMVNIMPKVLRELLRGYESTGADDQEMEYASHVNGQADQQSCEQHESNELKEALISLCETISDRWVNTDPNSACLLNGIAADEMCVKQGTFSSLIKEARNLLDKKKAKKSATESASSSTESCWLVELN